MRFFKAALLVTAVLLAGSVGYERISGQASHTNAAVLNDAALVSELAPLQPGTIGLPGPADAQRAVIQALHYTPYNSQLWLALAQLDRKRGEYGDRFKEAIKVSYYTGRGDSANVILRLELSILSSAFQDPEIRELAMRDIQYISANRADLSGKFANIYQKAPPEVKDWLGREIRRGAPNLLPFLLAPKQ